MTTPAVSINSWQNVDGYKRTCNKSGCSAPSPFPTAGAPVHWTLESRPASVSRKISSSGWRDPTAWNHSGAQLRMFPLSRFTTWNSPTSWIEYGNGAGWTQSTLALPTFPGYLEDKAVNDALRRLKDKRPNVDLATNFFERRQAAGMFSDRIRAVAKTVRDYRHRRPRDWGQVVKNGMRNELRNVPGSWLEVQYGWRPLLSDVYDSCEALNKRELDQDSYRASVKGVGIEKDLPIYWRRNSNISASIYGDIHLLLTNVAVCRLHYLLENPFIQTLASLGVTNPLNVIWERVPYSFVIDWALPVGNYLQLLDADFGWSFKSGTITRYQTMAGGGPVLSDPVPNRPSTQALEGGFTYRRYSHTRRIVTKSPWPRLPHLKNPLSLGHVANAMSLLVQAFK